MVELRWPKRTFKVKFPRTLCDPGPQFHHTGPFHDGVGRIDVDFPWERLTGEPIIYASMGTLMNGLPDVFRTITAATAKRKGFQLVLSVGDHVDPEQIGPNPEQHHPGQTRTT